MDAELIKDDGSTVRLSEYGVVQDFVVSSIPLESQRESVEGRIASVHIHQHGDIEWLRTEIDERNGVDANVRFDA